MNLNMFMKENCEKIDVVKYPLSKRFKDEDGNIIDWELQPITSELEERIKSECTRKPTIKEIKKGNVNIEFDQESYMGKLITNCVKFPDLKNSELQDNYGVMGAEKLIKVMLLPGEYADLSQMVQKINGFKLFGEEVEEAKN